MFFRKKKGPKRLGPYCACVVPAAGSSARMEGADKLMEDLGGEPVILRTLRALSNSPYIHEITVVTREDLLLEIGRLCRDNDLEKVTQVLLGGETRLESVYKGVCQVSSKAKLIAIHDGARPFVSPEVIHTACHAASHCSAAAPAVALKDTVKRVDGTRVLETVDRDALRAVQTPQVFDADLIRAALQKAIDEGQAITDDCSAAELLGASVHLTPGDEHNLKITTPLDLAVARALLSEEG